MKIPKKSLIISNMEETDLKPMVPKELSEIDDLFLDLKYKSVFFYKVLSIYNKYIISYISNYLDTIYKDTIRDYISNYYLENNYSLTSFRKDEIVREGKPLTKETLKVSLEPKVILEGLSDKYPTLDLETEYEKWKDYQLAHGKRYKNKKAAFRNWCRNAIEYQAQNGTITPTKVNTYKELFDGEK